MSYEKAVMSDRDATHFFPFLGISLEERDWDGILDAWIDLMKKCSGILRCVKCGGMLKWHMPSRLHTACWKCSSCGRHFHARHLNIVGKIDD